MKTKCPLCPRLLFLLPLLPATLSFAQSSLSSSSDFPDLPDPFARPYHYNPWYQGPSAPDPYTALYSQSMINLRPRSAKKQADALDDTKSRQLLAATIAKQMKSSGCPLGTDACDGLVRIFKDNHIDYHPTIPWLATANAQYLAKMQGVVMTEAANFLSQPQMLVLKKTWGKLIKPAGKKTLGDGDMYAIEKKYGAFFARHPMDDKTKELVALAVCNDDEMRNACWRHEQADDNTESVSAMENRDARARLFEASLRKPLGDTAFDALVFYRDTTLQRPLANIIAKQMTALGCALSDKDYDNLVRIFKANYLYLDAPYSEWDASRPPSIDLSDARELAKNTGAVLGKAAAVLSPPQLAALRQTWGKLTLPARVGNRPGLGGKNAAPIPILVTLSDENARATAARQEIAKRLAQMEKDPAPTPVAAPPAP